MTGKTADMARLNDLFDRHGGDLNAWPETQAAQWARRLALTDPEARRALDEARRLDDLLDARMAQFSADFELAERTVATVAPALTVRRGETRRWVAGLAASFLVAAVVGGAVGTAVQPTVPPVEDELAALDSLLYGPLERELQ